MEPKTIAVLMTCHNRKDKTLASIDSLFKQKMPAEFRLDVYLVDDASTDGTAEAVGQTYPKVKVIQGNGSLFWNGGMRLAWAEAMKSGYNYYFWLNDDTILYPDALEIFLATSRSLADRGHKQAIVAGSTCDPDTGVHTYGGLVRKSWWHPIHLAQIKPTEQVQSCDTMNGNCVLIPQEVVQLLGNLNPAFIHSMGDWDYGLRSQQKGCTVWVTPGYVAACKENPVEQNSLLNVEMPLGERLKKVLQFKGLPPGEWKVFTQLHTGWLWPFYWILPYTRILVTSMLRRQMGYRG